MKHKYKYNRYDYSKVLKKKFFFQEYFSRHQFEWFKGVFNCQGNVKDEELVRMMVERLKEVYTNKENYRVGYKRYNINDFDWEWKIVTPEKIYTSHDNK